MLEGKEEVEKYFEWEGALSKNGPDGNYLTYCDYDDRGHYSAKIILARMKVEK